jgi:hypothetical protein
MTELIDESTEKRSKKVQVTRSNSLKNFKLNKIRSILSSTGTNAENEKKSCLGEVKHSFVEWSLLTKFECLSKIFEYKNLLARLFWLVIFLSFSAVTGWLVAKCITDYLKYEIVTKTEDVNDRPTLFPAVTICDSNPFSSKRYQSLLNTTFWENNSNLTWSESIERMSNKIEILKMYAARPSFGDLNRKSLGLQLQNILSCRFNGEPCLYDAKQRVFTNFRWYYSYNYASCWQFNMGFNYTNNAIPLESTQVEGKENGLMLEIGGLFDEENFTQVLPAAKSSGLVIFIHNQTYSVESFVEFSVKKGEETDIEVQKIFNHEMPYPYTDCHDRSTFNSELVSFITNHLNMSYFQSDCFNLCKQKIIIRKCQCYYLKYPMLDNSPPCLSDTDFKCIHNSLHNFSEQDEKDCNAVCPHECDSVQYHLTTSSLDYPNRQYYDYLMSKSDVIKTLESLNVTLGYESFKESTLSLNVFLPYMEYTEMTQSPKFTGFDLLAQIGGALGVLLSMSIFTCIEFFEVALLTLYSFIFYSKK